MTLDEFIIDLENPNISRLAVDTVELLGFLKELKSARELIKQQCQYIEQHIDGRAENG